MVAVRIDECLRVSVLALPTLSLCPSQQKIDDTITRTHSLITIIARRTLTTAYPVRGSDFCQLTCTEL